VEPVIPYRRLHAIKMEMEAQMKLYRTKRRSCEMCKPHKMGRAKMWKAKELAKLQEMEREAKRHQ
jgi:hypothetical protein